jgi:hypothetical protein
MPTKKASLPSAASSTENQSPSSRSSSLLLLAHHSLLLFPDSSALVPSFARPLFSRPPGPPFSVIYNDSGLFPGSNARTATLKHPLQTVKKRKACAQKAFGSSASAVARPSGRPTSKRTRTSAPSASTTLRSAPGRDSICCLNRDISWSTWACARRTL